MRHVGHKRPARNGTARRENARAVARRQVSCEGSNTMGLQVGGNIRYATHWVVACGHLLFLNFPQRPFTNYNYTKIFLKKTRLVLKNLSQRKKKVLKGPLMQENLALFFFLLFAPAEIFEIFFLYDDTTRKKKLFLPCFFLVTLQHKKKDCMHPKNMPPGGHKNPKPSSPALN